MTEAESEEKDPACYLWVGRFPLYPVSLVKDADPNGNVLWTVLFFLLSPLLHPYLCPLNTVDRASA